jgi:glutathione S-transferase
MCPFTQKAWIALEVSQAPYESQEIPLNGNGGKLDWFRKLNPAGTVPVLVCNNGAAVFPDSDLILYALESDQAALSETPSGNPLLLSKSDDLAVYQSVKAWRSRINQMPPVGKRAVLSGTKAPL